MDWLITTAIEALPVAIAFGLLCGGYTYLWLRIKRLEREIEDLKHRK